MKMTETRRNFLCYGTEQSLARDSNAIFQGYFWFFCEDIGPQTTNEAETMLRPLISFAYKLSFISFVTRPYKHSDDLED